MSAVRIGPGAPVKPQVSSHMAADLLSYLGSVLRPLGRPVRLGVWVAPALQANAETSEPVRRTPTFARATGAGERSNRTYPQIDVLLAIRAVTRSTGRSCKSQSFGEAEAATEWGE